MTVSDVTDAVGLASSPLSFDSEALRAAVFSAFFSPAFFAASVPACLSAIAMDGAASFLGVSASLGELGDFSLEASLPLNPTCLEVSDTDEGAGDALGDATDRAFGAGGAVAGGLEGVFAADAEAEAVTSLDLITSFNSPYSFHSSTSLMSYEHKIRAYVFRIQSERAYSNDHAASD